MNIRLHHTLHPEEWAKAHLEARRREEREAVPQFVRKVDHLFCFVAILLVMVGYAVFGR